MNNNEECERQHPGNMRHLLGNTRKHLRENSELTAGQGNKTSTGAERIRKHFIGDKQSLDESDYESSFIDESTTAKIHSYNRNVVNSDENNEDNENRSSEDPEEKPQQVHERHVLGSTSE